MTDLTWWQAALLGLIQGLTEWIPVSSSGHLQLGRALLGLEASTWYDLLLHVGTLAVVVWVYRRRILGLTVAAFGQASPERDFAWSLVLASVPIALAGYFGKDLVEAAFTDTAFVAAALLVTAYMLWTTKGLDGRAPLGASKAWTVGLWQALALLPGVSRSGATIAGGLHAGLDRQTAADFAFLLAIPALTGATLFKALDVGDEALAIDGPMALGILISLVTGYVTLQWLRGVVARRGVHAFAPYCLVVGVAALVLAVVRG